MGIYLGNGSTSVLAAGGRAPHRMDVEWLHQEILPRWVGSKAEVAYTQDLREGMRSVRRGKAQALFVMQPPLLKEVFYRARGGLRMPGKTTYFRPKPLTGLVEYKFEIKTTLQGVRPLPSRGLTPMA